MLGVSNFDTLSAISAIDASDLKNGAESIETYPHITLMYGFTNILEPEDRNKLVDYFSGIDKFTVQTSKIGYFLNEKSGVSVLKYDVRLDDRLKLLRKECEKYDYVQLHSSYQPHLTTAYLKLGTHNKYIKSLPQPIDINISSVKISWGDLGHKIINLK